jgi:hypothetical protein
LAFVIDNSLPVAWCVATQATAYSRRLLVRAEREAVHAPAVRPFEFVNTLWSLERRRGSRSESYGGHCPPVVAWCAVRILRVLLAWCAMRTLPLWQ